MNATLLHRRRVERYAQLLEEATGERPSSHARTASDPDLIPLVALGERLPAAAPAVSMAADKRAEIRAFLLATAEREGIGVTAAAAPAVGRARVGATRPAGRSTRTSGRTSSARTRARARGAVVVGLAVGTLALSGISAASGDAMPGDTLYGLKLSQESAQLTLAGSSVAKGQLYLDFAAVRLEEAQAVLTNSHQLDNVLDAMDHDTNTGAKLLLDAAQNKHDRAALAVVQQFLAKQGAKLDNLRGQVVGPDHGRVLASINRLTPIALRAQQIGATAAGVESTTVISGSASHGSNASGRSNHKGSGTQEAKSPSGGASAGASTAAGANVSGTGAGATAGAGATGGATTSDPQNTDDGLLGDIGHVLGGLLGH